MRMMDDRNSLGFLVLLSMLVAAPVSFAGIDVNMVLNDGGFVSFDHFRSALVLTNPDPLVPDAQIFGILEILGAYYFWPDFTTEVGWGTDDIETGTTTIVFLEFDFPDIDDVIPFGPMMFWGAWYVSAEAYGYDVREFWLDDEHKWTPTPASSPGATNTPGPNPSSTPTPGLYEPGDLYSVDGITGNMRFAPPTGPGGFLQGSPANEPCRNEIDGVQFRHVLTRAIAVMETEVTRQMWADLKSVQPDLMDDPSFPDLGPTMAHPVQNATWTQAVLFANLLSLQSGYSRCYYADENFTVPVNLQNYLGPVFCDFNANGYRLPSEGEWEYFTRAGTTGIFPFDEGQYSTATCDYCTPGLLPALEAHCVYCANVPSESEVVGSKLANPWNLKDTLGNVWEWCWDKGAYEYPEGEQTNYTGPSEGYYRVYRGGGFYCFPRYCRSGNRSGYYPDFTSPELGFRLVRTII